MFLGTETTWTIITIKQQGMAAAVSGLEEKAEWRAVSNLLLASASATASFSTRDKSPKCFAGSPFLSF